MLDAAACAQLCAEVYQRADGWDHYWTAEEVVVAHRKIGDIDCIIPRGSQAPIDWIRDAEASLPKVHTILGPVPAGFIFGVDTVFAEIQPVLGAKVALIGHSLGAAHAMQLGGLFAAADKPALQITVFGCPRPGGDRLRDILCLSGTHIESYRNEHDPVTYVPLPIPVVSCHVVDLVQLHGGADPSDFTMFREHHIGRYITGLQRRAA